MTNTIKISCLLTCICFQSCEQQLFGNLFKNKEDKALTKTDRKLQKEVEKEIRNTIEMSGFTSGAEVKKAHRLIKIAQEDSYKRRLDTFSFTYDEKTNLVSIKKQSRDDQEKYKKKENRKPLLVYYKEGMDHQTALFLGNTEKTLLFHYEEGKLTHCENINEKTQGIDASIKSDITCPVKTLSDNQTITISYDKKSILEKSYHLFNQGKLETSMEIGLPEYVKDLSHFSYKDVGNRFFRFNSTHEKVNIFGKKEHTKNITTFDGKKLTERIHLSETGSIQHYNYIEPQDIVLEYTISRPLIIPKKLQHPLKDISMRDLFLDMDFEGTPYYSEIDKRHLVLFKILENFYDRNNIQLMIKTTNNGTDKVEQINIEIESNYDGEDNPTTTTVTEQWPNQDRFEYRYSFDYSE